MTSLIELKKNSERRGLNNQNNQSSQLGEIRLNKWDEEAMNNINAQVAYCKTCNGTHCTSSLKGYCPSYEIVHGMFYQSMAPCRHERARMQQEKQKRMFKFSGIPAEFKGDTFSQYESTKENENAVKYAHWAVDHKEKGVLYYGTRGSGKTKLAAIIANEKIKRGQSVLFASVPDLFMDLKASFRTGNTDELLQSVRNAEVLVLDDLGAERMTEWVGEQLFCLINYRMSQQLQTIVTTNHTPGNLIRKMSPVDKRGEFVDDLQGQRIVSRLCSMCYFVKLNGPDYRMKEVLA